MSGRHYTNLDNPQRRQHQNIGQDPDLAKAVAYGTAGYLWWIALICLFFCLLMFAFAISGAGVAWYLYAHRGEFYSWNAVGQVSQSGGLTSVLTQCTNLTFSTGSKAIKKHKNVTFYNTCPQPRSTCEIALCGGDGLCYFNLADGAQCSVDQDCIDLFNSTLYGCGSDCLCTNSSDWYLSGNLDISGDLVSYITTCSNETYASQQSKINGGKVVSIYNPCPQPRSTCEASLCSGDGLCYFTLANNSECASNQDCTELYNSTAYVCGSDCLCTNGSIAYNDWVQFFPQNVTSPDFIFPTLAPGTPDAFRYLYTGGYIQIMGSIQFTNISLVTDTYYGFIDVDISNQPFTLDATPNENNILGGGTMTPNTSPHETGVIEGYINSGTSFGFYVTFSADPGTNWSGHNDFNFLIKLA